MNVPDNWIQEAAARYKQKQQAECNTRKRRDLAEAAAPAAFQRIRDRLAQDLRTFHEGKLFLDVTMADVAPGKLAIAGPSVELIMELKIVVIPYVLSISGKMPKHGCLRISADLDGVTQIHSHDRTFADESEVSEFLLRPLLDAAKE